MRSVQSRSGGQACRGAQRTMEALSHWQESAAGTLDVAHQSVKGACVSCGERR